MRIVPLASGSQGNSLLLETRDGARVLIDAGLALAELEARLAAVRVAPRSIDALVLTHRHKDHVRSATEFARRHRAKVFAVRRTQRSLGTECHALLRRIVPMAWFEPAPGMRMLPIPVEHDAPDTVVYLVEIDGVRYGHATDLGAVTGPVVDAFHACDALLLEFNYEPSLLADGDYPEALKRRIAGGRGHLANGVAAAWLRDLVHPRLRHVWVAHVSRNNNRAELALEHARAAVAAAGPAGHGVVIELAAQDEVSTAFCSEG